MGLAWIPILVRPCAVIAVALGALLASLPSHAGPLSAGEELVFFKTTSNPADLDPQIRVRMAPGAGPVAIMQTSGLPLPFDRFEFSLGGVVIAATDFAPVDPMCFDCLLAWDVTYDGADRLDVRWSNQEYDIDLLITGGVLFGAFNTDFPGPEACRTSGICNFTGAMSPVDAPAGFALLALGLGILLSRRPNG